MVVANNIVVPVVLWGKHAPTHCISAIWMTPDRRKIVTACNDAQLCVWDMSADFQVGIYVFLKMCSCCVKCGFVLRIV